MLYKLLKSLFCPHKTHNEGAEAPAAYGSRLVARSIGAFHRSVPVGTLLRYAPSLARNSRKRSFILSYTYEVSSMREMVPFT